LAEAVAELATEQDKHRERQHICIDRPLQCLRPRVQRALDRRQRDINNRVVEHDHEQREAHRSQRPPWSMPHWLEARLPLLALEPPITPEPTPGAGD
jgi:hypothetical protein